MSEQRPFASEYERQLDYIRKLQAPQPDPLQETLAAIRDAITSRDRHFDALAEQLRQGFEEQRTLRFDHQSELCVRLTAFEAALKVLGAQLEGIERKLETVLHQLARLGLFDVIAAPLTAIEAQLTENKRHRKQTGRKKAKRAK